MEEMFNCISTPRLWYNVFSYIDLVPVILRSYMPYMTWIGLLIWNGQGSCIKPNGSNCIGEANGDPRPMSNQNVFLLGLIASPSKRLITLKYFLKYLPENDFESEKRNNFRVSSLLLKSCWPFSRFFRLSGWFNFFGLTFLHGRECHCSNERQVWNSIHIVFSVPTLRKRLCWAWKDPRNVRIPVIATYNAIFLPVILTEINPLGYYVSKIYLRDNWETWQTFSVCHQTGKYIKSGCNNTLGTLEKEMTVF